MTEAHPSRQRGFSGKGVFPPKYAFTLLIPLRNMFLSPKKLIRRLDLRESHTVLEIGPGPGYFSAPVARHLRQGTLVLLDLQREMLDMCRRRLEKRGISNVEYRQTDGASLGLDANRFDRVFMVTVIGEVENKNSYLREIHGILKEDGLLSISELAGDPDKLSRKELEALVCRHGFAVRAVFGNARNYTMNFGKTVKSGSSE
ncbi:MAG: class I SAM-dependent methyltransferase [Lentisphaeria bacterium]|nr:class I SAM-dependent methyltransferase [Lentisphaeria bacterium]